jgi:hypothetical protein
MLLIARVSFAVMQRTDPELMRRRLEPQPAVKGFERFVVAALDVRYGCWDSCPFTW